jgi:hypothetical protein
VDRLLANIRAWSASFHTTPSGSGRNAAAYFRGLRGVPLIPGDYIRGFQPRGNDVNRGVRARSPELRVQPLGCRDSASGLWKGTLG